MPSKGRRHTHKYHKITLSFARVWACGLPDCSHYMPQQMEKMVEGKNSICWSCGETFILDPLNMKEDKPRCTDCSSGAIVVDNSKSEDTVEKSSDEAIRKFLGELGL